MSSDISLLPEELRKKEETLRQDQPKKQEQKPSEMRFSIPPEEGEDVEVIEIDEGEIDQVLEGEPKLARFLYRLNTMVGELKEKFLSPRMEAPGPKLPPTLSATPPSKPKAPATPGAPAVAASAAGASASAAGAAQKAKAHVVPLPNAPRRVRVIKRVRKPVRVSFVSDDDLRLMHIDVAKRRFTLIIMSIMCLALLGGGYFLLGIQQTGANEGRQEAKRQLDDVKAQIQEKQKSWNAFQDLEPRLKTLSNLLTQHMSPTHLLEQIENQTLPTVYYNSFNLSTEGKVLLAVQADSLDSAARQIVAFQKAPFVKKVEASSYTFVYDPPTSAVPKSVQFQISLTLQETALKPGTMAVK
jgi:hypothetical protein